MTRSSKGRTLPETVTTFAGETKTRRQPSGRAPDAVRLRSGVTLSFRTLRRWHTTLSKAIASPRSASTAHALTDMAADIAALLGPAINPEYVPTVRPRTTGFKVTRPDGTEQRYALGVDAAKAFGVTRGSLGVLLSRSGGVYSVTREDGTWSIQRTYAERA